MSKKNKKKKIYSQPKVNNADVAKTDDVISASEKASEAMAETAAEVGREEKSKELSASENSAASEKKSDFGYYLRIAGVLTLICSFVALMLSVVNIMTRDRIEEIEAEQKKAAVAEIFGEIDDAILYEGYQGEEEVFLAVKDEKILGYCISVVSQGYGGEISMMVGIDSGGSVTGVKIISMSETAGVGSKTKNDSFLSQYTGERGPFTVGDNVDGISGATISSRAVTAGVNSAVSAPVDLRAASSSVGLDIADGDTDVDSAETDSDTESQIESESESSESSADTTVAQSPAIPGMENEDTHIDPSSVGQYQVANYYESDTAYTYSRDTGYYLQHETTDTESSDSDSET